MDRQAYNAWRRAWRQEPTGEYRSCVICNKRFACKRGDRPDRILCGRMCANKYTSWVSLDARAEKLRGRGEGKAYPKLNGRHAHRVVAEEMLGRKLRKGEIVHHKNQNILDYRPSNLEVLPSASAHCKEHDLGQYRRGKSIYAGTSCRRCGIAWAPEHKFTKYLCRLCYLRNHRLEVLAR